MASKKELSIKFRAETQEFTNGIKQMNSSMKTLSKEMKLLDAEMKSSGQSVEGLRQKQQLLSQKLQDSAEKIKYTEQCLEQAKSIYGENSTEVQKWSDRLLEAKIQNQGIQNALDNTTSSLNKMQSEVKQNESAYGQLVSTINRQEQELEQLTNEYKQVIASQDKSGNEAQELRTKISQLNSELQQNKSALNSIDAEVDDFTRSLDKAGDEAKQAGNALDDMSSGFSIGSTAIGTFAGNIAGKLLDSLADLATYLLDVTENTREFNSMLSTLEASAVQFGYSTEETTKLAKEMYGYLGDEQQAINAVTNIQAMGLSTEQTNETLQSAINVWSAYGDSIPIESLTESINETAQVGKVTGVLADAINWTTGEEEAFNSALEKCQTTEERANLITAKLNEEYGKSGETWRESQAEMIAYNESVWELNNAEAELGIATAGMSTKWNEAKTAMINFATQIATAIPEQFRICKEEAILIWNSVSEFLSMCWQGIQNVANVIWTHITTSLSNAWNTISTTATTVWNSITSFLSMCWQGIKNVANQVWTDITTGISNAWNNVKTICSNTWNSIKSTLSNAWNNIKSTATSAFNTIKSTITNAWNNIKSTASSAWSGIKSTVSNAINNIKSTASSSFNSIKSTIGNAWSSIKSKASSAWSGIKSTVSNAISSIKSKLTSFKPSWSIPKPKLPKVSVSIGTKSIGGISIPFPKFSVSWGWKGGIVQNPMLFNTANGVVGAGDKFQGQGSNAEAIIPLDSFYRYLDDKLESTMNNDRTAYAVDRLYDLVSGLELSLDIDGREFTRRAVAPNQRELDSYRNLRKK